MTMTAASSLLSTAALATAGARDGHAASIRSSEPAKSAEPGRFATVLSSAGQLPKPVAGSIAPDHAKAKTKAEDDQDDRDSRDTDKATDDHASSGSDAQLLAMLGLAVHDTSPKADAPAAAPVSDPITASVPDPTAASALDATAALAPAVTGAPVPHVATASSRDVTSAPVPDAAAKPVIDPVDSAAVPSPSPAVISTYTPDAAPVAQSPQPTVAASPEQPASPPVDPRIAPLLAALTAVQGGTPQTSDPLKPKLPAEGADALSVAQPATVSAASAPAAPAATPDPAPPTVTMLAAQQVVPTQAEARSPGARKPGTASDDTASASADDAGKTDDNAPALSSVTLLAATEVPSSSAGHHAASVDGAGQTLSAAGADRQVDIARSNAWLDGLARDISATADGSSPLRFQVSPQSLGTVHVELSRGDDGSAVKLTAASEATRDILTDARPQLIAEAQKHGVRIADAQVDVGNGQTRSDQGSTNQQSTTRQPASGFSAQAGSGGEAGRQQAQQKQDSPDYRLRNHSETISDGDDAPASTPQPTDAFYA